MGTLRAVNLNGKWSKNDKLLVLKTFTSRAFVYPDFYQHIYHCFHLGFFYLGSINRVLLSSIIQSGSSILGQSVGFFYLGSEIFPFVI